MTSTKSWDLFTLSPSLSAKYIAIVHKFAAFVDPPSMRTSYMGAPNIDVTRARMSCAQHPIVPAEAGRGLAAPWRGA